MRAITIGLLVFLNGCTLPLTAMQDLMGITTSDETVWKDGRPAHSIRCGKEEQCYAKAGELCQSGYDMLNGSKPEQSGAGHVLVVACHGAKRHK
jgi:hypothetical protein